MTCRPLSASGPTEEVRQGGIGLSHAGNAGCDGNNGWHTTASDPFEVNGGVGELKSSHIMAELIQHLQTRHVPYCSQCFDRRSKWGNAMHGSTHRLQHNTHHNGAKTAKTARSGGQTSICHDTRPQWPSNRSKRESQNIAFKVQ